MQLRNLKRESNNLNKRNSIETLSEHGTEIDTTIVNLKKDHGKVIKEKENEVPGKKEVIECKECDKSFKRNCDLERHIEEHELQKEFKCDICGKEFYLKWRMLKHKEIHTETKKFCHYYNYSKLNI